MFLLPYTPPEVPPEVPTMTLQLSPPGWDCPMVIALAMRLQAQGYSLQYVEQRTGYNCEVYIVGTEMAVEHYQDLLAGVLKTTLTKE